jgi:hypothetical protein
MLETFGLRRYKDPLIEAAFNEYYFQHGKTLLMAG